MNILWDHPWPTTVSEARAVQEALAGRVRFEPPLRWNALRVVAGADISYSRGSNRLFAAVVLLDFPSLQLRSVHTAMGEATFPYVPGYLSFREIPVLLKIFRALTDDFDALLCDGHGYAHPRRFGLACHLGTLLDRPTVGCAKSKLIGEYQEPGEQRGSMTPLMDGPEQIGWVVRTRSGVKPVFVSPGNHISLKDAARLVLETCTSYRLPEPIRQAHIQVNQMRACHEEHSPV